MLSERDFARAARVLGCDVPAIQAVAEVESRGDGFLPSGRLKVLFEGHIFHRYTKGLHDAHHPTLSFPKWSKAFYLGGEREWERVEAAKALNARAALLSTSWGRFQIMGFNHVACGFGSVEQFVDAMAASEGAQLDAFVAFVRHTHLDAPLREARWADFAKGYNGPGYAQNAYDVKLAQAHAKYRTAA